MCISDPVNYFYSCTYLTYLVETKELQKWVECSKDFLLKLVLEWSMKIVKAFYNLMTKKMPFDISSIILQQI